MRRSRHMYELEPMPASHRSIILHSTSPRFTSTAASASASAIHVAGAGEGKGAEYKPREVAGLGSSQTPAMFHDDPDSTDTGLLLKNEQ